MNVLRKEIIKIPQSPLTRSQPPLGKGVFRCGGLLHC